MNQSLQDKEHESSPALVLASSDSFDAMSSSTKPATVLNSNALGCSRRRRSVLDDDDEILLSPDTHERMRRMSSEVEATLDKMLAENLLSPPLLAGPSSETTKNANFKQAITRNNATTSHHDDDDDDDDEINDEMNRLKHVSESLRQDLDKQNVDTMKTTLRKWQRAGQARYKYTRETIAVMSSEFASPKKPHEEELAWDWTLVVMLPALILVAIRYLVGPVDIVQFLFGY